MFEGVDSVRILLTLGEDIKGESISKFFLFDLILSIMDSSMLSLLCLGDGGEMKNFGAPFFVFMIITYQRSIDKSINENS